MFIQTESTPNPATLKFLPGRVVLEGSPREFLTAEQATVSPLAGALFEIPEVTGVFFGADFITVTSKDQPIQVLSQLTNLNISTGDTMMVNNTTSVP